MNPLQRINLLLIINICVIAVYVQGQPKTGDVRKLLQEKKFESGARLAQGQINESSGSEYQDSLAALFRLYGEAITETMPADQAINNFTELFNRISEKIHNDQNKLQVQLSAAAFYEDFNRNNLAYRANLKALKIALKVYKTGNPAIASIQNDLGVFAQRMGDLQASKLHHRAALAIRENIKPADFEILYQSYNSMGGIQWYMSDTDSALYFFTKASDALEKTEQTPYNKYYRSAIILNNVSALYNLQGNVSKAIEAMQTSISNVEAFLNSAGPHPKKKPARTFLYQAIDNLGGIYKEMGNFTQAKELLNYSYRQKKIHFDPASPEIFKSEIFLGEIYNDMHDFAHAEPFLQNGLKKATQENGDAFMAGDAAYGLALLYEKMHRKDTAAFYYLKTDSLYSAAYQGEFDNIYLEFIRNASLFYADNQREKEALALAYRNYNYVKKKEPSNTLLPFYEALNLSEVYFRSGMFKEAKFRSEEALNEVNKVMHSGTSFADSVRIDIKKPKAILLQVKAAYKLQKNRDSVFLKSILNSLNEAMLILERRNELLNDPENSALMMADHEDLLNFIKEIEIELFKITADHKYIDNLLSIHESGMYHRIRSRLSRNEAIRFVGIPDQIHIRETAIRRVISDAVKTDDTKAYIDGQKSWENFLAEVRLQYPAYYQMRFGAVLKPLNEIIRKLPENTQVVRYVFAGTKLSAVVIDHHGSSLTPLDTEGLETAIEMVNAPGISQAELLQILYKLYLILWAPLENKLNQKNIIIVPDRILFNLSFESLITAPVSDFTKFASNSLLSKYSLAYHYSLFLLQPTPAGTDFKNNYTAFSPVFSDDIKKEYLGQHIDSMYIDNGYLSLLPLPFTLSLVNKTSSQLGGTTFLLNHSTLPAFKQYAGNASILHIGTHAEANNQFPEFSRLIFAKDTKHPLDTNSLFLFDIYNCTLHSALTVLTACETGKPGFKDGEGMISLGHAFNYAGSESILTSLWKIDEQSSTIILEKFYELLEKGSAKDEALREAKLYYLSQAKGRMLAPQYWAGMVLMGDRTAIDLKKTRRWKLPAIISSGILLLIGIAYRQRSKKSSVKGT